jgi:hypothetical protein
MRGRMLCNRLRWSERSVVSMYRVYSVSTDIIVAYRPVYKQRPRIKQQENSR